MQGLIRLLVVLGIGLLLLAGLLFLLTRFLPLGKLPGDFVWRKGNVTVFFPLATMLLLSLILTLIANLFLRR